MYPLSSQVAHDKDLLEDDKIQLLSNFLKNNAHLLGLTFYYHWNTSGGPSRPFRELTTTHCEELYSFLGVLAARMRALGHRVSVPFVECGYCDEQLDDIAHLAGDLSQQHARLSRVAEELVALCMLLRDAATADLLRKRCLFHKKAALRLARLRR